MIEGLRDEAALRALGLPRRTVVRLGALSARGLSFTEALLEAAGHGSALEKLILDAALLDGAAALDAQALEGLARSAGVAEQLALVESSGARVVALEEELLAQQGWSQAAPEGSTALAELARGLPAGLAPATGAAGRARAELFPPEEVERLKLTALTSARADEAVSALRRLACAPIPAEARGEVFIRALAGPEAAVRAEAARLLAGVGLGADVSEALAALAAGEAAEQRLAIDRLGKVLADRSEAGGAQLPDLALIAALMGMTAALDAERSGAVRGQILAALAGAAGVLGAYPERMAGALRHAAELLITDYQAGAAAAYGLLGALGDHAPAELGRLLRAELGRTRDRRVRTFLLAELAALRRKAPAVAGAEEVAGLLADELADGGAGESDQQALGGELFKLPGSAAAAAVLKAFGRADGSTRRGFLRLLADLCRFREVAPELVEGAGRACLASLKGARKDLRLAVLETLLPADGRLSEELRGELAAAYMENFGDLVFRTDLELAESTLARMGRPALRLLLERLGPAWPEADRARACRVIGEIGRAVGLAAVRDERCAAELAGAERRLLELALGDFPDLRELALALGKVAGALGAGRAALETAWRRIGELKLSGPVRLEAQSFLAAGAGAPREMVEESAKALLEALAAPEPESLGRAAEYTAGSGRVLELSGEAAEYVNSLPVVVRALVRVAGAPGADVPLGRRVLTAMINRWKDLVSGRRLWGPAAAATMIEGLRDLATGRSAGPSERLAVIRALGLRLADPPAMRAISEVLAADDAGRELAAPAASAALALLNLRGRNGRFPAEDRAEILAALGRILGRRALETGTPRSARLRERLAAELFEGLKDEVPGVLELLSGLAESAALPEALRQEIAGRLAARPRS